MTRRRLLMWETRASPSGARGEVSFIYSPTAARFYLSGGQTLLHESYDPATDQWATVAPMADKLDLTTPNHDASDFVLGQWTSGLAPLPTPRSGSATAVLDGDILVIGGAAQGGTSPSKAHKVFSLTPSTGCGLS